MAKKYDKIASAKADEIDETKVEDSPPEVVVDAEEAVPAESADESEPDQSEVIDAELVSEDDSDSERDAPADIADEDALSENTVTEGTQDSAEASSEENELPQPIEPATLAKSTGFIPVFLGGVAAAAIGFGAATIFFPDGLNWSGQPDAFEVEATSQLQAQSDEIAALKAAQGNVLGQQDLTKAMSGITAQLDEVKTTMSRLEATVGGFDARITDLEKRPLTEAISPAAIRAYEREIEALKESVSAQRADAQAMEDNARESARMALGRSAMTRVVSALDSGVPYRAALVDLASATGAQAPAALDGFADDGVPTRAVLEEGFPIAARAALAVARKSDGAADGGSRLGTFLKNQLGARSVAPKEGVDADAILSRAEAALREGRLADTLAELDALSEDAKAELSGWISVAQSRADALAAAETLAQSLNSN